MPGIPDALTKLVIGGHLASGVQTFSTSIWVLSDITGPVTQASFDSFVADCQVAIKAMTSSTAITHMTNSVDQYDALTGYYYPPSHTSASLVSAGAYGSPDNGDSTTHAPKETSLVASLRSSTPGRSGRGRLYLPACGVPIGANGLADTTAVGNIGGVVKTCLSALNAVDGCTVAVASFTKGIAYPVVAVIVDNKPDTQRRRQDQLTPTYTFDEQLA